MKCKFSLLLGVYGGTSFSKRTIVYFDIKYFSIIRNILLDFTVQNYLLHMQDIKLLEKFNDRKAAKFVWGLKGLTGKEMININSS